MFSWVPRWNSFLWRILEPWLSDCSHQLFRRFSTGRVSVGTPLHPSSPPRLQLKSQLMRKQGMHQTYIGWETFRATSLCTPVTVSAYLRLQKVLEFKLNCCWTNRIFVCLIFKKCIFKFLLYTFFNINVECIQPAYINPKGMSLFIIIRLKGEVIIFLIQQEA